MTLRLAYFISPHGFGHAARAAAVMGTVLNRQPGTVFDLYTTAPEWFFVESLPPGSFHYHSLACDVGLAQTSPLHEDLNQTVERLAALVPFRPDLLTGLARQLQAQGCRLVVCDIAPLGIAVAQRIGLPSVLIENFTWDWIYQGYLAEEPRLAPYIAYFQQIFAAASYHIQAEPVCAPSPSANLIAGPISRAPRLERAQVRQQLGVPPDRRLVLVTMGGIQNTLLSLENLPGSEDLFFVIPGASQARQAYPNGLLLPHHSGFYHPDLVHASDAILGKAGYSTLAEAYAAGVPFLYVSREKFREMPALAAFIHKEIGGFEIQPDDFAAGDWIPQLLARLADPRQPRRDPAKNSGLAQNVGLVNGAQQAAEFLLQILHL